MPDHGKVRGCPLFLGDLRLRGSEEGFEPSLPLLIALVDAICARGDAVRIADAERLASRLGSKERPIAVAHLARLSLRFGSASEARSLVCSIRAGSIRAGAGLLLTRAAIGWGRCDEARQLAATIGSMRMAERARLEIAHDLFGRGLVRRALRALHEPGDPTLLAERLLLRAEIRLAVRRDVERAPEVPGEALRCARAAPAWTGQGRPDPGVRHDMITATTLMRCAIRTRELVVLDQAARSIVRVGAAPARCRALLVLMERAGVDVGEALVAMRGSEEAGAIDPLRAEHLARRAERLGRSSAELPAPMRWGLAGELAAGPRSAGSIERALFDEGLALSPSAARRRRALIATAKRCLRAALSQSWAGSQDVVAARLRTLVHLGGALGRKAIARELAAPPEDKETWMNALEALCALDATEAARIVLARAGSLAASGIEPGRALQVVEAHGGVPRGLSRAFARAHGSVVQRLGVERAPAWMVELVECWRARTGFIPDALVLDQLAALPALPASPAQLLRDVDRVQGALARGVHTAAAARVASDRGLLAALLLSRPARVDQRMEPWATDTWCGLLRETCSKGGSAPARSAVQELARALGDGRRVAELRSGDLARLGVEVVTTFAVGGQELRLRLLDKRIDLLTYLRFADVPARSCYRSDSGYYHGAGHRTQEAVIEVWKDPLSFCFHIERRTGDTFQPCGFFFGGFAEVDGTLAVVMNSLHMRPNSAEARQGVVRALEQALCRPLEIRRVGIASLYGGRGPLPCDYFQRPVRLRRFRALALGERLLLQAFDDISNQVNTRVDVDHLWWRAV